MSLSKYNTLFFSQQILASASKKESHVCCYNINYLNNHAHMHAYEASKSVLKQLLKGKFFISSSHTFAGNKIQKKNSVHKYIIMTYRCYYYVCIQNFFVY